MKNTFTKQNLQTGDIVVLRNGELGIVLREMECIVYQNSGADELMYFDDDLRSLYDGRKFDIMAVYRDGVPSFYNYFDSELLFKRDEYVEPNHESINEIAPIEHNELRDKFIFIMSQAFYGNRTCTEIHPDKLDRFILGILSDIVEPRLPVDRTIVHIPNTDNLVIIYNKYQEKKAIDRKNKLLKRDNYVLKPLAVIEEINLEIYSRCIVCRMDEQGELKSLQDDDYKEFIHYLAQ